MGVTRPSDAATEPAPGVTPLLAPREGVPEPVSTPRALDQAALRLAGGHGPVAVDAERASGYRYGQRAYLVQLRRAGAGTVLIDPVGLPDLQVVSEALRGVEWVLHAASQDLPCLRELSLAPDLLFDTELAGRLLGHPRVGLAALVQTELGIGLAKEHSAVDWSTRPLPGPWLAYAALDVELLVDLRDRLDAQLVADGKREWARQEFEATRTAPAPPPRVDPWRRTSGLHKLRSPRQLAIVRELWLARDTLARERDVSSGRVLPDAAIVVAAQHPSATSAELARLPGFTGRGARRHLGLWAGALQSAQALPESALPSLTLATDGPPPPRSWAERDAPAAARLTAVRAAVALVAATVTMPTENVLPADAVKRISWTPPTAPDLAATTAALRRLGAREWQIQLTASSVSEALSRAAADQAPVAAAAVGGAAPVDASSGD
jgi:ribonuclease D